MVTAAAFSAETVEPTNHLFKITLPEGWLWKEQAGRCRISDPKTGNAIAIQFGLSGKHSSAEIKELLKNGTQAMTAFIVNSANGTVLKDEERKLGGAYARQLTFLQPYNGETGNGTYISLFHREYAFTISFGSLDKGQVAKMKQCVETLQLK